ncbi:MAG: FAD-dependent monooxygenase [Burkholderiaceae bacterium]
MRPDGRGELDSLYFDYPHFAPAVRPGGDEAVEVAIIGAGPVGLVAALTLARHGVRCVVIERKDTFNDGSRAICIARQSFHILERLGAVQPFLDKSLGWTKGRSFFRGRQILEFEMPHSANEKFLPMYNLEQQYIEQFLWLAAQASPLIEIRWQSELFGVHDEDGAVRCDIRDPAGSYALHAGWLLAADGARSAVRGLRGLALHGENHEGRYVIADVQMKHDYPTIRRALFDPASNLGGTVLVHRQPDDIWRIDYQIESDESAESATREQTVRAKVGAILADIGHTGDWQLEWWSTYTANTLALDDYRDGRVFFVGDSAHIVPIFGVRGLNNGLADGENIGWKLAMVINGQAGEGLLDSYSPERRGATMDVFANATRSTRFMTPPSHGWRMLRDAALSLSLSHAFARPFANPRQMTPYTYRESPLTRADTEPFEGGPAPGAVMANLALSDGGHLSDHLGTGFSVLVLDERPVDVARWQAALAPLDPTITVLAVDAGPDSRSLPIEGLRRLLGLGYGGVYLVRPDMHIAARWQRASPEQVAACLAQLLDRDVEIGS